MRRGKNKCVVCGKNPAAGWAWIGDDRYCHGDDDPDPTCYMVGSRKQKFDVRWPKGWRVVVYKEDFASREQTPGEGHGLGGSPDATRAPVAASESSTGGVASPGVCSCGDPGDCGEDCGNA